MARALRVFLVGDEVLSMMQMETYLEAAGHTVVGTALSSREAREVAAGLSADIALVDIRLADGPTGMEVGRFLTERMDLPVVYLTANPKRLAADCSGAIGVIAKPYTQEGVWTALTYLADAVLAPPPTRDLPRTLQLSPAYARCWAESRAERPETC